MLALFLVLLALFLVLLALFLVLLALFLVLLALFLVLLAVFAVFALVLLVLVLLLFLFLFLLLLAQEGELEVPLGVLVLGLGGEAGDVGGDRPVPVLAAHGQVAELVVRRGADLEGAGLGPVLEGRARALGVARGEQDQAAVVVELGALAATGDGGVEARGGGVELAGLVGGDGGLDVGVLVGEGLGEPAGLVFVADPEHAEGEHEGELGPHDWTSLRAAIRRRSPMAREPLSRKSAGIRKNM